MGRNRPLDAQVTPRFAGPTTFLRLPAVTSPHGLNVAIVGIPFDAGASYRPGARFGPRAVREMSSLLRPFNRVLSVDPFDELQVADMGDLAINPLSVDESLAVIQRDIESVLRAGAFPLSVGGDHTITLGTLRGLSAGIGQPVSVVHVDAHLDTWDSYFGSRYTHGTFMRRAIEEGVVDAQHSIQVGIRGPLFGSEDLVVVERLGLKIIPVEELMARPLPDVVQTVRERTGGRPVYLTLDVDSMDPAFAPGTGTPEVGGLTSHQVVCLVQGLVGLTLVGADIVEVSPPYDQGQITALAAARFLHEILSVLAASRRVSSKPTPGSARSLP